MAEIEVKEQCKSCFHFQVCANILKQQLFVREIMLKEENPKCEYYKPTADVVSVVRCMNCEHAYFRYNSKYPFGVYACKKQPAGRAYKKVLGDFFCADGERRCEDNDS